MKQKETINLYWEHLHVGSLSFVDNKYVFYVNRKNVPKLERKNFPAKFLFRDNEYLTSETLFPFYAEFIPEKERDDLLDKYGIKNSDTDWEKLIKCAENADLKTDSAWISVVPMQKIICSNFCDRRKCM